MWLMDRVKHIPASFSTQIVAQFAFLPQPAGAVPILFMFWKDTTLVSFGTMPRVGFVYTAALAEIYKWRSPPCH
jgi:hypothetical protein